jgi:outer membrane protein
MTVHRLAGFGILIGLIAGVAGAQQLAYVDINHLIANSDRGKEIQQQLQREFAGQLDEMRAKETKLSELRTLMATQSNALSQEAQEQQRREFQDLQLELQRMTQDVERAVQKRQAELFSVLEKEVLELLEAMRKEKGLSMVFSKQASGLVAADPSMDITDEALVRLNTAG